MFQFSVLSRKVKFELCWCITPQSFLLGICLECNQNVLLFGLFKAPLRGDLHKHVRTFVSKSKKKRRTEKSLWARNDILLYCHCVYIFCAECGMNVHHKCQKKVANLCGVNQKLMAEALAMIESTQQVERYIYFHHYIFLHRLKNIPKYQMSNYILYINK